MARGSDLERQLVLVAARTKTLASTLRGVIEQIGCNVALTDLLNAARAPQVGVALVIVEIGGDTDADLCAIAELRRLPELGSIPLLAITSLDPSQLDLWQLRALGVSGLMHAGSLPEHIRFRIGQMVHVGADGRRYPRAPCSFPVSTEIDGKSGKAWGTSLGEGGMGLICRHEIPPNTAIHLRFELEGSSIEAQGRTVSCRPGRRPDRSFEIGLFFHRIEENHIQAIRTFVDEVTRRWKEMEAGRGD